LTVFGRELPEDRKAWPELQEHVWNTITVLKDDCDILLVRAGESDSRTQENIRKAKGVYERARSFARSLGFRVPQ